MSGRRSPRITSASAAVPEDDQAPAAVRIRMSEARTLELAGGGSQAYAMGQCYLVPPELAAQWIAEDAAVDPDHLPTCPECGAEGESRQLLARHVAANHPATPAPLRDPAARLLCAVCGAPAETQLDLDRHVAANHPAAAGPAAPDGEA